MNRFVSSQRCASHALVLAACSVVVGCSPVASEDSGATDDHLEAKEEAPAKPKAPGAPDFSGLVFNRRLPVQRDGSGKCVVARRFREGHAKDKELEDVWFDDGQWGANISSVYTNTNGRVENLNPRPMAWRPRPSSAKNQAPEWTYKDGTLVLAVNPDYKYTLKPKNGDWKDPVMLTVHGEWLDPGYCHSEDGKGEGYVCHKLTTDQEMWRACDPARNAAPTTCKANPALGCDLQDLCNDPDSAEPKCPAQ